MVADMQNLVKEVGVYAKLKELEAKRPLRASAVAKLTSVIMFERRFSPLLTQVILGGVDSKPQVWVLDPLGSLIDRRVRLGRHGRGDGDGSDRGGVQHAGCRRRMRGISRSLR